VGGPVQGEQRLECLDFRSRLLLSGEELPSGPAKKIYQSHFLPCKQGKRQGCLFCKMASRID
jgi:hypothetical protein